MEYELVRAADAAAVVDRAARFVVDAAAGSIAERGRFRIALAGGSTPKALYRRLATPEFAAQIRWAAVEVFFGDERGVAPDHPDSNYAMAEEALLRRVPLDPARVHRMEGELDPAEAARRYEAVLGHVPLDLALLGLGEDGHTASLFPGSPALSERDRWVAATVGTKPPPRRITLTLAALDAARQIAFLVTGAGKAAILPRLVRELDEDAPTLPAALVRPGKLYLFADVAALPD